MGLSWSPRLSPWASIFRPCWDSAEQSVHRDRKRVRVFGIAKKLLPASLLGSCWHTPTRSKRTAANFSKCNRILARSVLGYSHSEFVFYTAAKQGSGMRGRQIGKVCRTCVGIFRRTCGGKARMLRAPRVFCASACRSIATRDNTLAHRSRLSPPERDLRITYLLARSNHRCTVRLGIQSAGLARQVTL